MLKPALPPTEKKRLRELRSYHVLDTLPERLYDNIAKIASEICGTPIALVSLIDENRQWFKARVGLDATETPRDISFCGHAILQPNVFEVQDAHEDPRFRDNPLVEGGPKIRFYAGAPLRSTTGEQLGTLCVIDHEPKKLTSSQIEALTALADQVVALLEMRLSAKQLADATEAKSQFLANMSHEIRTPLSAILGFADIMRDRALGPDERSRYLKILDRNGRALARLVDDILDLSKVEAKKLSVEKIPFSVGELIREIFETFDQRDSNRSVELVSDLQIGKDSDVYVSDPFRVRQILTNLIGNALKFTHQGQIRVVVEAKPNQLSFSVSDTGIGIAPEHKEKLFKPFGQADISTPRNYGGTGLGLYLTRELCELLGGTLELTESTVGRGSTFTATIEAKPPTATVAPVVRPAQPTAEPPALDLQGRRVLLVDDSEDNQVLFSVFLSRAGANVIVASDGRQALGMASAGDFDVILMDIEMPEMDGITATRALRDQGYLRPIIALTAHALVSFKQQAKDVGFSDFLAKPVTRGSLVSCIAKHAGLIT